MHNLFDTRQSRRAAARAASRYDDAAALHREVESRLLEQLDYLEARMPEVILDAGSGPAHAAATMKKRWPRAQVLALDSALPMLQQSKRNAGWLKGMLGRDIERLCADLTALPLADASVDVVFCNLCLYRVDDLERAFAGFRRVLKPGGMLLASTFGAETLAELGEAFASADAAPHVGPFVPMGQFGDALMRAGFRDPVLDRDRFVLTYSDTRALMHELRALGDTNALATRRRSLTGRGRFEAMARTYEQWRDAEGRLPSTWEVVYAHAWAPPPGAPMRERGQEIAAVPVSAIPIRRKQ